MPVTQLFIYLALFLLVPKSHKLIQYTIKNSDHNKPIIEDKTSIMGFKLKFKICFLKHISN